MEDKKQLVIVMECTALYANKQSTANNPIAVAFVNWINEHELIHEERYIILKNN